MQNNTQTEVFKLCPNCSAKCKAVYQYCNECGAALQNISANEPNLSATQNPTSFTPAPTIPTAEVEANNQPDISEDASPNVESANDTNTQNFTAQHEPEQNNEPEKEPIMNRFFDGVSAEDMFNYTGKKPKLYAKLKKQQMAPMIRLFCLPLFLLGLFFGFFGMACWYIYHKLYKQAVLFFGLTLFFYIVNIVGAYSIIDTMATALPNLFASSELTDQQAAMFMQTILKGFPILLNVLSYIGNLAQFVLAIVMPFYAYNTYRLTAIERIKKARLLPYGVDISSVGGTAKGYLALAIGIGIIIIIIATSLLMLPIFETILKLLTESPELFEEIPSNNFIY